MGAGQSGEKSAPDADPQRRTPSILDLRVRDLPLVASRAGIFLAGWSVIIALGYGASQLLGWGEKVTVGPTGIESFWGGLSLAMKVILIGLVPLLAPTFTAIYARAFSEALQSLASVLERATRKRRLVAAACLIFAALLVSVLHPLATVALMLVAAALYHGIAAWMESVERADRSDTPMARRHGT